MIQHWISEKFTDHQYFGIGGFGDIETYISDPLAVESVVIEIKAGGGPRRKPKPKQVMIDGQRYVVNTPEEEFFLLQAHLDKKRNQYEADILKKKTPQVKKNIKLLSSQVTRIENRLTKVEEQLKWRQKIKRNNQIILALLAA